MSLPLVLRRVAEAEYDAAFDWYEQQQPGLGVEFADQIQAVFDTISAHPKRYPVVELDIREAPVHRFPYCVYYRIRSGRVIVTAVFHASRDPAEWMSRM